MKPRLTEKILAGLSRLRAVAEAGGPADVLGYDEESECWENEGFDQQWAEIEAGIEWVRAMRAALTSR